MTDSGVVLTQAQYDVLAKVYKEADVEETGVVDAAKVPSLATKILGSNVTEHETQLVVQKTEAKGSSGTVTFAEFVEIMMDVMMQTTRWGYLQTKLDAYVGFDTIQDQIRKKFIKRGFEFNVMVVGESGLGKSTMINTLFRARLSRPSCTPGQHLIPPTTEVNSVSHVIEEQNVRLKLTVTDTPGFGDQINNDKCWTPILDYINDQFDLYLNEENSMMRKKIIPDTRVHCCLYFIAPTGHSLKPLDIEFMKRLDHCVNIVPIIAKSDTLTVEEREAFKQRIREDIHHHGIHIYPSAYPHEDDEDAQASAKYEALIPFAVIGSDREHNVNNKRVLGRQTKWGFVEVENKKHCEFSQLRDMLIKTHMQDLKETTDTVHYENFRQARMSHSYAGESNI